MSQILKLFYNCYEQEDDSDSDDNRPAHYLPKGPLLLEQYEAQIQSIITSSL